jgi:hypothetical protein
LRDGRHLAPKLGNMMSRFRLLSLSTVVLLVATTLTVAAQPPAGLVPVRATPKAAVRSSALATILGNALNPVNGALPDMPVRVRDARLGRIVGSAVTDKVGAYSFKGLDPGNYVVEIVSPDQTPLASTNLISANAGDTVHTIVKLPFRPASLGNILGGQAPPTLGSGKDNQAIPAVVTVGPAISER